VLNKSTCLSFIYFLKIIFENETVTLLFFFVFFVDGSSLSCAATQNTDRLSDAGKGK
jgi:hypothetical protein